MAAESEVSEPGKVVKTLAAEVAELTQSEQALRAEIADHQRSEAKLRESESWFRTLAEATPSAIFLWRGTQLCFSNPAMATITGYSTDELLGKDFWDVVHPEDREFVKQRGLARMRGEPVPTQYEIRIVTKQGEERTIDLTANRIEFEGEPAVLGTAVDITDRRRTEAALLASESRLRQIIDLVPHMIFAKDQQGKFVLVNRAVAEAYNTSVEELIGRPEPELHVSAEEVEHFLDHDRDVIESGVAKFIPEETWTSADGQTRFLQTIKIPMTLEGAEPAVLGVAVDITELKQAERQLKSLNETLEQRVNFRSRTLQALADELRQNVEETRLIVDGANEAFISMNAEGVIQDWNPQAEATFGWTKEEAIGRVVADTIVPLQYRGAHVNGLNHFLTTGEGPVLNQRRELRALHKDGHEFPVEFTIAPIRQKNTFVFHAFLHDITERKAAQAELERLVSVLEATPDFVGVASASDFRALFVNRSGRRMVGLSEDADISEMTVSDFHPASTMKQFESEVIPTAVRDGSWSGESAFVTQDGQEIPVSMVLLAHKTPSGEVSHFSTVSRDITSRQRADATLAEVVSGLALPQRGLSTTNTAFRLNDFSLKDMNLCGAIIRGMSVEADSSEDVAARVVRFFYEQFVDEQSQQALALARCFEMCPFEELSDEQQSIVRAALPQPTSATRCMRLVATAGDEPQWNDTKQSTGHRAIPLPSEEAVNRLPMISQLIDQLGLQVGGVLNPGNDIVVDATSKNVFHVAEAVGSAFIPAQDQFVIPYGVKSVVGFGDLLPNGNLFVVILFSKVPISRDIAILFSHLSLSVRIALLPFVAVGNKIETQLLAIDRLLKNHEEIVAGQESKLRTALDSLSNSNTALARSNLELQHFAYVASHDLQEPLRAVASFCELLQRHYQEQLDERATEWIGFATEGAKRMQSLVHDLLTYSRVESRVSPIQVVDCMQVVDHTLKDLKPSIDESGAEITHDELPTVMSDAFHLDQLFRNLIANAIKYRGQDPPRVHVSAEQSDHQWLFSVRDNGIGIEPDYHEKIFEIFKRLHHTDDYPGTGIGLAICRTVVERLGGRIWVESEPGQGSTFYFSIPTGDTYQ